MQSLRWYVGRLKAMSLAEILWRVKSEFLSIEERCRVATKIYPSVGTKLDTFETGFSVSDLSKGEWLDCESDSPESRWLSSLLIKADNIVENKLSFF